MRIIIHVNPFKRIKIHAIEMLAGFCHSRHLGSVGMLRVCSMGLVLACLPYGEIRAGEADVCRIMAKAEQRLSCYDRVYPPRLGAPENIDASIAPTKQWIIQEKTSALDDSREIRALLEASIVSESGTNPRDYAWLSLNCSESKTSVMLITEMFMHKPNPAVAVRIGKSAAENQNGRWRLSTTRKDVGLWGGKAAIPFIRSLPEDGRLVIRVRDSDQIEATFDLGKVSAAVARVAAACGWKP